MQLDKLEGFISSRKANWKKINDYITKNEEFFIAHEPTLNSEPSWFGYAITVKDNNLFNRDELVKFLNENRIATRLMFGGNLIRQPAYKNKNYRVHGKLENADTVMESTFWIGVYPGLSNEMIDYMISKINYFLKSKIK